MNSRIPPQNPEAEKAVLEAVLFENESIGGLGNLRPEDFYLQSHAKIWQAMVELSNRSEPIDLITLSDALKARGVLESVGGAAYLASLNDGAFTAANAVYHGATIKNTSKARRILKASQDAIELIYEQGDSESASVELVNNLLAIQQERRKGDFYQVSKPITAALKTIEKAGAGELIGISIGILKFDRKVGRLQPGWLFIIAGRTGNGKTILAVHIAVNAAKSGHGVAFVSAEMSAEELAQRMLSTATGVENRNLRRGIITDKDATKLAHAAGELSSLPLWFLDSDRSWTGIKSKIRSLKIREPKLALVILDYVGLIKGSNFRERYREVGEISAEAKSLAMELKVLVILVSQLNREADDRPPRLSDLRESGNLEQDADLVGLLFQPSKFDSSQPQDLVYLNLAKNRHGATGAIELRFKEETVSFSDWMCERPAE
jgi:replicative DNA helicase